MIYDYIIVGAGSAGAPLAARLSENTDVAVLVLEAGPDYRSDNIPMEMRILNPAGLLSAHCREYWWPNLIAQVTDSEISRPFLRGRGLGGSSAVNGLIAMRGMLEDYDIWHDEGCIGWSAQEVLPSFIALESDLDFGTAPYHGTDGPIPICRMPIEAWGSVDCALRDAALNLGYRWAYDHNALESSGVSPLAMNSLCNRRVSTNDAYLDPIRDRDNLHVRGNSSVDKVLIQDRKAIGVVALIDNKQQVFYGREIILSAGSVHSPAILMRSGVGLGNRLSALGIDVVVDLPVGENAMDHPGVLVKLHLRSNARALSLQSRHSNCCVRFTSKVPGSMENDMVMISGNLCGYDEAALSIGAIVVALCQPLSRGKLSIISKDPELDPKIELRLLSDEYDLRRLREGVRGLFDIARHDAVSAIADEITVGNTGLPLVDFTSDDQIDEWILADVSDGEHIAGTCRMGSANDPRSVVDHECHVIGMQGLRVVDASIMPYIPRANTHLTTVMIAEHVARLIKEGS